MRDTAHQITPAAFNGLLASLGPDRALAGDRYLEIRHKLVRVFEWRGCSKPDEYADEAINRCAKRIGEGEEIRDVATYCIGIARMLLREMSRERGRERSLAEAPEPHVMPVQSEADPECRLECLRHCLAKLSPENRDLILNYYQGDKAEKIDTRKRLTQVLGVAPNTLRMRALRVRETLHLCAENCLKRKASSTVLNDYRLKPVDSLMAESRGCD